MKRQAGFSLVELMVSITLALLLTGAVVSVFIGSRTAYQSTAGVGEMSDGGRFALDLIGESVRSAGNLACHSTLLHAAKTLLPVTSFINNYAQGITGFEANGTAPGNAIALTAIPTVGAAGNWTPTLDPAMTGAIPGPPVGSPVLGSDVLVVYSSVPRVNPVYTTADVNPGATVLSVAPVPASMAVGQYGAIADCTKSLIFNIAGVTPGAPSAVTLNAALPLGFSAGALVAPLSTTIYYIGVGSDGDSSLWRLEQLNGPGFGPAEELVPDVENMQVLYGIDTIPPTQSASAYVTGDQLGAATVVSLQVALLVASPPSTRPLNPPGPYNLLGTLVTAPVDNRMRQVFYATINLRSAVN